MSKPKTIWRICILMEDGYVNFDPGYYLQDHTWSKIIMDAPVLERLRSVMEQTEFDVYLNLCEGYEEPDYSGLDIVRALEKLRLPFTGADSQFYAPSREEMQAVAERHEIGFARGVNIPDVGEAGVLTEGLSYPLMVKHPNSYGSTGMTRNSRVETLRSCADRSGGSAKTLEARVWRNSSMGGSSQLLLWITPMILLIPLYIRLLN